MSVKNKREKIGNFQNRESRGRDGRENTRCPGPAVRGKAVGPRSCQGEREEGDEV